MTEIVAKVEGFAGHHKVLLGTAAALVVVFLVVRYRAKSHAQAATDASASLPYGTGLAYTAPSYSGGISSGTDSAGLPMPPVPAPATLDMAAFAKAFADAVNPPAPAPKPAPPPPPPAPGAMTSDLASGIAADLYTTELNRAGDAHGLAYWTNRLMGGESVAAVRAEFDGSAEYQALHPAPAQAPAPAPAPAPSVATPAPAPAPVVTTPAPYVPPSGWSLDTRTVIDNTGGGGG